MFDLLQLLKGFRPVVFEEAGEGAVGEEAAFVLALGAVVGFVFGEDDALDGGGADGAGEAEAARTGGPPPRIGVLGTPGTIRSGAYQRSVSQLSTRFEVLGQPAPLLVPAVSGDR